MVHARDERQQENESKIDGEGFETLRGSREKEGGKEKDYNEEEHGARQMENAKVKGLVGE